MEDFGVQQSFSKQCYAPCVIFVRILSVSGIQCNLIGQTVQKQGFRLCTVVEGLAVLNRVWLPRRCWHKCGKTPIRNCLFVNTTKVLN
jgi:hypothetical protein